MIEFLEQISELYAYPYVLQQYIKEEISKLQYILWCWLSNMIKSLMNSMFSAPQNRKISVFVVKLLARVASSLIESLRVFIAQNTLVCQTSPLMSSTHRGHQQLESRNSRNSSDTWEDPVSHHLEYCISKHL